MAKASVLKLPPSEAESFATRRKATLCALHLSWPALDGSALLVNITLRLPFSAQSIAWQTSGLLSPAAEKVGLGPESSLAAGSLEPSALSPGLASVSLRLTLMPLMEEDKLANRTVFGAILVASSTATEDRPSADFVPGTSLTTLSLAVERAQQYLYVSVSQRSSVSQLLASALGLLSGLGVFFRLVYVFLYGCVKTIKGGPPDWERKALIAKQSRDKMAASGAAEPSQLRNLVLMARQGKSALATSRRVPLSRSRKALDDYDGEVVAVPTPLTPRTQAPGGLASAPRTVLRVALPQALKRMSFAAVGVSSSQSTKRTGNPVRVASTNDRGHSQELRTASASSSSSAASLSAPGMQQNPLSQPSSAQGE